RFLSVDPIAPDIFTPPSLNRYQYCLNNPGRFVDSSGGYDEEVHRDLTAALAYVVGFSEQQGNQIANADQWLDEEGSGASAMMAGRKGYDNRLLYYFTTEERRNQLWSAFEGQINFYGNDPLSALGTYLHAQQDSFSHEGFGPGTGQGWAIGEGFDPQHPIDSIYEGMAKYDKTNWSPEAVDKAVRMSRDTLGRLLQARNLLAASGRFGSFRKPVPYENDKFINDKLREWALAPTRDDKRVILFQIMNYVTRYYDAAEGTGRKNPRRKKTKTSVRILDEEE
ncbi:MAG: hypothetical protein AB1477_10605, partial [Acidobacteriota bacterium]